MHCACAEANPLFTIESEVVAATKAKTTVGIVLTKVVGRYLENTILDREPIQRFQNRCWMRETIIAKKIYSSWYFVIDTLVGKIFYTCTTWRLGKDMGCDKAKIFCDRYPREQIVYTCTWRLGKDMGCDKAKIFCDRYPRGQIFYACTTWRLGKDMGCDKAKYRCLYCCSGRH